MGKVRKEYQSVFYLYLVRINMKNIKIGNFIIGDESVKNAYKMMGMPVLRPICMETVTKKRCGVNLGWVKKISSKDYVEAIKSLDKVNLS